jgi:hypothetical protein
VLAAHSVCLPHSFFANGARRDTQVLGLKNGQHVRLRAKIGGETLGEPSCPRSICCRVCLRLEEARQVKSLAQWKPWNHCVLTIPQRTRRLIHFCGSARSYTPTTRVDVRGSFELVVKVKMLLESLDPLKPLEVILKSMGSGDGRTESAPDPCDKLSCRAFELLGWAFPPAPSLAMHQSNPPVQVYFGGEHPDFPKGGVMTQHLDSLRIGGTIEVLGPKGVFQYHERGRYEIEGVQHTAKKFGFVCGGSGITPAFQVIQAMLSDAEDSSEIFLIFAGRQAPSPRVCTLVRRSIRRLLTEHACRTENDLILKDTIDRWAEEHHDRCFPGAPRFPCSSGCDLLADSTATHAPVKTACADSC